MISPGSLVIVHLTRPSEKFWGVLHEINSIGLLLRGLNVSTFDDWMAEAVRGEKPSLGLSAMFVPMARVERIFLDEQVGEVESYAQRFERRVGLSVLTYLGLPDDSASASKPH